MSYHNIEPESLSAILSIPCITIIDQRDDATRSKGELAGAVAPDETLMSKLVQQRRQNPPVLVYCYHGNQSRDLCAFLSQFGLQQVYNLAGGWDALQKWKAQQPA